jgi:hypothetical protein
VHREDLLPAGEVWRGNEELAVEAARAEQSRVEVLDAVGRRPSRLPARRCEAVELDQELVQRLVLLAVEAVATAAAPTASSSSMKMIAGRVLAAVSNSLRIREAPSPGEHLDEGGGALGVEARPGLVARRPFASSVLPVPGGP